MKKLFLALGLSLAALASQAADVGVSISVGQPGFYGRIELGDMPRPQLIYAEPVYIQRQPRVVYEPIYLRVPPGHERNWGKHCGRYGACGRPVYFVRDNWYREVYVPRYRHDHDRRDRDHGGWRDDNERRHDRHDDRRDDHRGKGHGNGHGNGHGKGGRD